MRLPAYFENDRGALQLRPFVKTGLLREVRIEAPPVALLVSPKASPPEIGGASSFLRLRSRAEWECGL